MNQKFHDHFSAVANRYADFRPRYPAALFDFLAQVAPSRTIAWDCAAGTGQATLELATRFRRVVATDASEAQIAAASPHPQVTYRVALAEESGLPDRCADLITVAQAMHWFHFERFHAEARRVLAPDGVLAVWAYGINKVEVEEIDRIVQESYSATVGPYRPPERTWVEEGYRTIPFPFEEIPAPGFRMETNWTLPELLGYFSTWSATNRYIQATGINPVEDLGRSLASVWGDPNIPLRVTWPLAVRVGRKV